MSAIATLPRHIMAVRCHWCSKQRPHYRSHRLASNQVICDYCVDWHIHALEFLGGGLPKGCQVCERTFAELHAQPGIATRMFVVPKDGIYQVLCAACAAPYTAKRADLYTGTKFGKDQLKIQ